MAISGRAQVDKHGRHAELNNLSVVMNFKLLYIPYCAGIPPDKLTIFFYVSNASK